MKNYEHSSDLMVGDYEVLKIDLITRPSDYEYNRDYAYVVKNAGNPDEYPHEIFKTQQEAVDFAVNKMMSGAR